MRENNIMLRTAAFALLVKLKAHISYPLHEIHLCMPQTPPFPLCSVV